MLGDMMLETLSFQFLEFDCLDSTNEEAKRLINSDAVKQVLVIRARQQTAGRGTQGRRWISPAGAGLYFSIVHPFERLRSIPLTPVFTVAAGVGCARALQELTQLPIQLKPVNDLYVAGRKLGGILTESMISNQQCRAMITGIGINILKNPQVAEGCEEEQRGNNPTSLEEQMNPRHFSKWSGEQIAQELQTQIAYAVHQEYQRLLNGEYSDILNDYSRYQI